MWMKALAFLFLTSVLCTVAFAQEKLTPELFKRIEAESPKPLPQSPAVKRESTDAQDDGYKGKVKRIIEEYRGYQDVCASRGRVLSDIDDYDAKGNKLRNVSFANCGELVGMTVYGFIDGSRVSLYKGFGGPRATFRMTGPPPKPNPATQRRDERYTYKYEYTYTAGQLSEMRMFNNDGSKGMYYRYTRTPVERSTSAFTSDDQHNWRSVDKLDEKGNEIESITVDVRKVYGYDTVYRIENKAFDKAGNWTHRAKYRVGSENGKTTEILMSEEFRTITYH